MVFFLHGEISQSSQKKNPESETITMKTFVNFTDLFCNFS
jgi:hypothetical protein